MMHHPPAWAVRSDPRRDAEDVHKAMKGAGTNEKALINIICRRNPAEIQALRASYADQFKEILDKAVESETSGRFREVLLGVLRGPNNFYAEALHRAIAGAGTDEHTIFEILVGTNRQQLDAIKFEYEQAYKKTLRADLEGDLSGDVRKLAVALVDGREPEGPVNREAAQADAERLYKAGEGRLGTDEAAIIEVRSHRVCVCSARIRCVLPMRQVFSRRSYSHLHETFRVYESLHKHHTMQQAVDSEFSGLLQSVLSKMVTYVNSPGEYHADRINSAVKGAGTNDTKLIRVLVGQYQNLGVIKDAYLAKYKKPLLDAVRDDVSGDYQEALLALIGA
eukprot:TRINITY_DN2313_c0_g1_i3.p1 TRINITY_DN2313_c0_g1~~TRINITY_DN2313_c0_g1_i3.p1  ORF type:complete len:336 (-),score=55.42 TRINITY_DN2313_c0_g1_i3:70-1077(-)